MGPGGDTFVTGRTESEDFPLQNPLQSTPSFISSGWALRITEAIPGIDAFVHASAAGGGQPGGLAAITVRVGNHGQTTATGAVLQATLNPALAYHGDTSGVTPVVSGNSVSWNFGNVPYGGTREFVLYVRLPAGAVDLPVGVTLSLQVAGSDVNAGNNTAVVAVRTLWQVLLPQIQR